MLGMSWSAMIGLLLGGAVVGYFVGQRRVNQSKRFASLQNKLKATEDELHTYRQEVNQHFSKTADLINGMTESYQNVHQHLSKSAATLCSQEIIVNNLGSNALEHDKATHALEEVSAADNDTALETKEEDKVEVTPIVAEKEHTATKKEPVIEEVEEFRPAANT